MTPWVTTLIMMNAAMFVATISNPSLIPALELLPAAVGARPWTLLTYMFLHGGLWHLLFNMLGLFFLGPRVELRLGPRHFLGLYFFSGLTAAGLSCLVAPNPIIGASGAIFGVVLAFAHYWPREPLYIWGVLPVEARWLAIGFAGLSLYLGVTGAEPGIAHFAHLGGFLGGWIYLRVHDRVVGYASVGSGGVAKRLGRRLKRATGADRPSDGELERWSEIRAEELHEVNRENLERIREKIDAEGAQSLTSRERAFLDRIAASQKAAGGESG